MAQVSLLVSFLPHHCGRISLFATPLWPWWKMPRFSKFWLASHWERHSSPSCCNPLIGLPGAHTSSSHCVARPLYLRYPFPPIPFSSIPSGFILYLPWYLLYIPSMASWGRPFCLGFAGFSSWCLSQTSPIGLINIIVHPWCLHQAMKKVLDQHPWLGYGGLSGNQGLVEGTKFISESDLINLPQHAGCLVRQLELNFHTTWCFPWKLRSIMGKHCTTLLKDLQCSHLAGLGQILDTATAGTCHLKPICWRHAAEKFLPQLW